MALEDVGRKAEETAVGLRIESGSDDGASVSSLRVLLVEDSDDARMILATQLEMLQHQVIEAANGAEAVERFGSDHFDVILMDLEMPVMDGREAARRIRELERTRSMARTVLVAMTAHAVDDEMWAGLVDTYDHYLWKTCDRKRLSQFLQLVHSRHDVPAPVSRLEPSLRARCLAPAMDGEIPLSILENLVVQAEAEPGSLMARLIHLEQGHGQHLRKVRRRFVDNARQGIRRIEVALRHDDLDHVQHLVHLMKGAAGLAELPNLAHLGGELEGFVIRGERVAARGALGRLEEEVSHMYLQAA